MTTASRGRVAPSPPPPYPGKAPEPAGAFAFSWNAPRPAINPLTGDGYTAPTRTKLADLIALYAAENEQARAHKEKLSDQVWSQIFNTEERDPELREFLQEAAVSRARMAHDQHRNNPDLRIIDDLRAQPGFISKPLLSRIDYLQKERSPRLLSRYLRDVVAPSLTRLDRVRDAQVSASFRFVASRDGLDGLLALPAMNQNEVKQLATRVSAVMDICLIDASEALMTEKNVTEEQIWRVWERVAAEASRLDVTPPSFEQLRRKRNRRKPVNYDLIPGSLARMRCADWWYKKLWQLRCEWREEQLRAVCLVSKRASPYISNEAVIHKREQRRKALEFFRSHELVNEDGDTLDMEDVVNASASNPAHRRNEMMACVKGMELIAEMRKDCAVFYTITTPSRFHATLSNGKPNPTWSHASIRQSSDYLVAMFASFRKAMHRAGLRWYGLRVAEPHHDGTVHWHLLCFMRKKDRRKITALLRKFAIREDRAELGNNTGPRFKSELINPRKGSPTSYIAKYVSKNIDGRGLSDTVSKETGKSLRDTAEHVTAWASLHRVQQFRFFGIPSRQAYRELRLFAGQSTRSQPDAKPGAPVLDEPRLDAVLAAADVGCFATYITKQGGVLVPRSTHLIRTAYELTQEPGAYGDHGTRVYGFWSPLIYGRICTHATTWKMVKKSAASSEASADQGGPAAPWTRGNNCPPVENSDKAGCEIATSGLPPVESAETGSLDYDCMTRKERRELLKKIREEQALSDIKPTKPDKQTNEMAERLRDFARSTGWEPSEAELTRLLGGHTLSFDGQCWRARADGALYRAHGKHKKSINTVINSWLARLSAIYRRGC
ncbi:replication endonuclease [Erwinia amylovora]|uniref:replication endonuclease n=1 Tax=Erwinia amylovora TaxID=552 RepID=UPI0014445FE8|nr:replication endonuclease [Erwinia amylovora]